MSNGTPSPIGWRRLVSPTTRIAVLIWLIAIVVSYLVYNYFSGSPLAQKTTDGPVVPMWQNDVPSPSPPVIHTTPPAPHPNMGSVTTVPPTPVAAPRPTPEDLAAVKMHWIEIKGQIQDVREDVDAAVADTAAWTALVKQLPSNEPGKRIAGSKVHIDRYRALLEQPRQPARLAAQYRDTLQIHLETAQRYLGQTENSTVPASTLAQELDRLKGEAKTLAREYHRDRLALEQLVSETATMPPAEVTLEKAVEQREREVAGEYLAQLAATKAAAEAEGQRKLREVEEKAVKEKAQAEADRRALLGVQETQRIRDETEQRLAIEKETAAKKKRDDEAKRLRAIAEDLEVQKLFSCFLEKGYLQFTAPPRGMMSKSQRPTAVSFGELNRHGWLKDVESFATAMSRSPSPNYDAVNDRPTRGQPKTEAEWAETARLLDQFKTLGPVWVEMKLLEP